MSHADTSESDTERRAEQDLREARRAESFFAEQVNSVKEDYRVQSSKLADDFLVQQAVLKTQHATSAKLVAKLAALAPSRGLAIKRVITVEESQPRKLQRVPMMPPSSASTPCLAMVSYVQRSNAMSSSTSPLEPLEAKQCSKLSRGQKSRKRQQERKRLLAQLTAASGEEMDSLNFEGAVAGDDGTMDSLNLEGAVADDDGAMIDEIFKGVLADEHSAAALEGHHPRPPSTPPPPWKASKVAPKAQPKQHSFRRGRPRPPKAPPTAPIRDVVPEWAQAEDVDAWLDADTTW